MAGKLIEFVLFVIRFDSHAYLNISIKHVTWYYRCLLVFVLYSTHVFINERNALEYRNWREDFHVLMLWGLPSGSGQLSVALRLVSAACRIVPFCAPERRALCVSGNYPVTETEENRIIRSLMTSFDIRRQRNYLGFIPNPISIL